MIDVAQVLGKLLRVAVALAVGAVTGFVGFLIAGIALENALPRSQQYPYIWVTDAGFWLAALAGAGGMLWLFFRRR